MSGIKPDFANDPDIAAFRKRRGLPPLIAEQPEQGASGVLPPDMEQLANDPAIAEFRKRRGLPPLTMPSATPPAPEPEGPGVVERGVAGLKGASKAAAGMFFAGIPDFVEGAVLSPAASAWKAYDPEGFEKARAEAQKKPDYLHVPTMGELAGGLVTAPIEAAKAAFKSNDPEEAAYNAANAILMTYGLYHGGKSVVGKIRGTPPAGPPGSPREAGAPPPTPTATPVGQPLPEPPAAETIISDAEAARNAKKAAQNKQASILAKRRLAWAAMTPEQRAWVTPELPVPETEKSWGKLSDEHKALVNKAWTKVEPASDTNLDTSGSEPPAAPPPTAGEAGGEPGGVPSGEAGAGAGAGQDPSVVGEIGASTEPDAPRSKHSVTVDELNAWRAKQGLPPFPQKSPVVGSIGQTPVPPVADLSRGTHGTEAVTDPGQALGPGDLLNLARERGVLGNQTTSPGALETGLPPRTPEAEAVMRGEATSRDAERTQNLSSAPVDPLDAQLDALKQRVAKEGVPARKADLDEIETGKELLSVLRNGKIVQGNEVLDVSPAEIKELANKRLEEVDQSIEGAQNEIDLIPENKRTIYNHKLRHFQAEIIRLNDVKKEYEQALIESQTKVTSQAETTAKHEATKARRDKEDAEFAEKMAKQHADHEARMQAMREGKPADGGQTPPPARPDIAPASPLDAAVLEADNVLKQLAAKLGIKWEPREWNLDPKLSPIEQFHAKMDILEAEAKARGVKSVDAKADAEVKASRARGDKALSDARDLLKSDPATTPTPAPPAPDPATLGAPAEPAPAPAQEPAPTPGAKTKGKGKVKGKVDTGKIFAGDAQLPREVVLSEIDRVNEALDAGLADEDKSLAKDRLVSLNERLKQLDQNDKVAAKTAAKPKKEPTLTQQLDRAESANDAALDKGQITQEQWDAEQNRIAEERLKLYKAKKAAATTVPADPAAPARVTQKAIPVDPNALDPRGFPGRMRDNLKQVTNVAELERRLTELVSRRGAVVGDKAATKIYQDRINQVAERMAELGEPPQQRYAGGPSPIETLKDFLKGRKVLRDKTPEQMSPAERKIAESVITEPDLTQPLGLQATLRKSYQLVVDSQSGFKRAASNIFGKGSSEAERLSMLAEVASGALTRAEEVIRGQGPMLPTADGNWVRTGNRSIHDVIQLVGGQDQVGTLGRVWSALNTIELWSKRGKVAGPDLIAAQMFIKEVDPKFIAGSIQLRAIAFDLAQYAHWGGLITDKALADFAQQQYYAPIRRLLAHEGEGGVVGTSGGRDVVSPSGQPIRRLKGSRKPQLNPVETLIDNTYRTIRAAEQNYRVAELVKGARDNPTAAKGMLEPASHQDYKAMQKLLDNKADAAVAEAAKQGVPLTKEQALTQLKMTGDETLNITDNLLHVWIDGKPALWRVSDELSYAVKHMQAEEFKLFTKIAGLPAALVHAGVVGDPSFIARQLVLDSMQGYINSRYGFNPLKGDQIRGWLQLIRNTPIAQEYRLAGGGFSGLTSSRFRSANTSLADAVRPRTSGPLDEAVQQLKEIRPVQAWKTLVAPFEEAARVGEYMRARGAGASMLEAVYAAKRITTNFQRSGGEMMAAAHTVPFLNAAIQGIAQAGENFSRAPKQWTQRAVIAAAVPAFTLWWMNKDDEQIQELRKTESGQRYFFYRAPDGTILKQRKPYLEGAIFANGIEAGLDAVNEKNPAALVEWGKAIAREAGFNPLTTLGYVPLSLWANKDLRTGLPIVPDRVDGVDPEYQAGPYTGSASRIIGEATGTSPAQVEFGIKNTLGGAGSLVPKAVDAAIDYHRTGAIVRPADIPGLNSFIAKYPTQSVKSMQDFYRESERLAKISNTIKYLGDTRPELIGGYIESHKPDLVLLNIYGNTREKIGASQRSINLIRDMPAESITQSEKEDLINSLILDMIQQAKITNEIAKQLR